MADAEMEGIKAVTREGTEFISEKLPIEVFPFTPGPNTPMKEDLLQKGLEWWRNKYRNVVSPKWTDSPCPWAEIRDYLYKRGGIVHRKRLEKRQDLLEAIAACPADPLSQDVDENKTSDHYHLFPEDYTAFEMLARKVRLPTKLLALGLVNGGYAALYREELESGSTKFKFKLLMGKFGGRIFGPQMNFGATLEELEEANKLALRWEAQRKV